MYVPSRELGQQIQPICDGQEKKSPLLLWRRVYYCILACAGALHFGIGKKSFPGSFRGALFASWVQTSTKGAVALRQQVGKGYTGRTQIDDPRKVDLPFGNYPTPSPPVASKEARMVNRSARIPRQLPPVGLAASYD
uniref:Uncharacterized protein n=1 Tax=Trichuris muris TaxID=70415 RepID=A0A5S6QEV8_TRIMR